MNTFILKKFSTIKLGDFAKFTPYSKSYKIENFYNSKWQSSLNYDMFPNPINGYKDFLSVPNTQSEQEFSNIIKEMKSVSKSGLHNPLKNTDRYLMLGEVTRKLSCALHNNDIFQHFVDLIKTVIPKSKEQANAEFTICRNFLDNFAGDNVRYLAKSFHVPGDYTGQQTTGYRWPYGPVSIVSPFNFPLEIVLLQLFGALYMGNKPLVKVDSRVSLPMQDFVRLMHECGLPKEDMLLIHADGENTQRLLSKCELRTTCFTGSSKAAEKLTNALKGKVKLEDSGLDWKMLGPDVENVEYVAHMIDHDAYALSGQKCSAQSLLFVHKNWLKSEVNLYRLVEEKTKKRNFLSDMTISPLLSWSNKEIISHINLVLEIKGSRLLWGGKPCKEKNSVPECYGLFEPTAITIPINEFLNKDNYNVINTELFGPFQLIIEYDNNDIENIINFLDNMEHKLTCGVVSNNLPFLNKILGHTSNGTTYAGIRARTTGAPQNHFFGPGGDPRGGGIGSIESIQMVWSHHREIVYDYIVTNDIELKQS